MCQRIVKTKVTIFSDKCVFKTYRVETFFFRTSMCRLWFLCNAARFPQAPVISFVYTIDAEIYICGRKMRYHWWNNAFRHRRLSVELSQSRVLISALGKLHQAVEHTKNKLSKTSVQQAFTVTLGALVLALEKANAKRVSRQFILARVHGWQSWNGTN